MRKPQPHAVLLAFVSLGISCSISVGLSEQPTTTPETEQATATATAPLPTVTSVPLRTELWPGAGFSIQIPLDHRTYRDQKPSVDGYVSKFRNGLAIGNNAEPSFLLSIQYLPIEEVGTLEGLIRGDVCSLDPELALPVSVASQSALLFPDTLCGPYGTSYIYFERGYRAYRIMVETLSTYETVSPLVMELLSSIEWTEAEPVSLDQSAVSEARLISPTEGWVRTRGTLLWTSDGGDSWREITPPGMGDVAYRDVFFLDANLGWVATSAGSAGVQESIPIQVLRTQDGGGTWSSNELVATLKLGAVTGPRNLEFVDPLHGWLSVDQTLTMNSSAADLYRTSDGGVTWERSTLPFGGDTHFITPAIGWALGSCCTGAPNRLYRTVDGGLTWQEQTLAPNPDQTDFEYSAISLPEFADDRNGALAVRIRDALLSPVGVALYRTGDSGETWPLTATLPLPPHPPGISSDIAAQFLEPETWIVFKDNVLYRSFNGGETWEQVPQRGLAGFHDQLQLATANAGWSVVFRNNCGSGCLLLYRTIDGGLTWAPVLVSK